MARKSKKLLLLFVTLLAIGGTMSGYAYWDTLTKTDTDNTVTIGVGVDLVLTDVSNTGAFTLIPAGAVQGPTDVYSYVYVYNVVLSKEVTDSVLSGELNLSVVASSIEIGGATTHAGLIGIAIDNDLVIDEETEVVVTVTVTLTEPGDVDAYNAIINEAITFDLTFSATKS